MSDLEDKIKELDKSKKGYCTRHQRTAKIIIGPVKEKEEFYVIYDCCGTIKTYYRLRGNRYS